MVVRDGARARCKMLWVFRVNTYFERVPSENNVFLADRQWVACRNRKLFFDEVYTGDHFCDGVLYLDTRVHFNKEELAIFIQEFKGTGAAVADLDAGIYTALGNRSEEHTSELQSRFDLVCRLLLAKKNL